jgi:hypothetical protein
MRIVVQIGCRCPLDKQDAFLDRVRGFGPRPVPAKWHEQLMVVGAEGLAGGSSGGGGRKGKGKMPAAADDGGVSSSDQDAVSQLEEQEQLELACLESFRAAGCSTGSSSSSSGSSSSEGAGQAASTGRASSRACRPPPGVAGASGVNYARQ